MNKSKTFLKAHWGNLVLMNYAMSAEVLAPYLPKGCELDLFECEVKASDHPYIPEENSMEHFFKEHELGVGHDRQGNTLTYNVHHPFWRVFSVRDFHVKIEATALYGEAFAFLGERRPNSVVLAEGSKVEVYKKS